MRAHHMTAELDRVDRALGTVEVEDVEPLYRVAEAVYERGEYAHSI